MSRFSRLAPRVGDKYLPGIGLAEIDALADAMKACVQELRRVPRALESLDDLAQFSPLPRAEGRARRRSITVAQRYGDDWNLVK
jgi:hypothetical protein